MQFEGAKKSLQRCLSLRSAQDNFAGKNGNRGSSEERMREAQARGLCGSGPGQGGCSREEGSACVCVCVCVWIQSVL